MPRWPAWTPRSSPCPATVRAASEPPAGPQPNAEPGTPKKSPTPSTSQSRISRNGTQLRKLKGSACTALVTSSLVSNSVVSARPSSPHSRSRCLACNRAHDTALGRAASSRTCALSLASVSPLAPTTDQTTRFSDRNGTAYWSKGSGGRPEYRTMTRLGMPR